MTSALPKSRIIFILAGLILLLAIPLTVFVAQQQQKTKQHASFTSPTSNFSSFTKDYQQLIREKAIDPVKQILTVSLFYDESKDPKISLGEIKRMNGYVPYYDLVGDYSLQILDNEKNVLYALRFEISNTPHIESFDPSAKVESPDVVLKQMEFAQTVPWYPSSSEIVVLDPQGHVVATKALLNIPEDENIPNFHSIRGDEFLKKVQNLNLINLNFENLSFPKAFAGSSKTGDGFVDIVFIGDKYNNDFDRFHEDIGKLISGFLKIEPFKSRASQIRFNYVDNKIDLRCGNNVFGVPGCDKSRIVYAVNNNGLPYDHIVVLNNDSRDNTQGITSGRYTMLNPKYMDQSIYTNMILAHEVGGHGIGKLYDEYTTLSLPVKIFQKTLGGFKGNCYSGTIPNPEWENLVGKEDYTQGCLEPDWFRSSRDDLMMGYEGNFSPYFSAVSQNIINERLDQIVGPFTEDKISPQVSFMSPDSSITLSKGSITIKAQATDDKGVAYVQLWVDNVFLKTSYVVPYDFVWDASAEKEGPHTLQLKAYDVSGNVGQTERGYSLTINNMSKVKIILGANFQGGLMRVDIEVPEENKNSISRIESFVDDKLEGTAYSDVLKKLYEENKDKQYGFWIDLHRYSDGLHKFYAKAYNDTGGVAVSDTITFNIVNSNFIVPTITPAPTIIPTSTPIPAVSSSDADYNACIATCNSTASFYAASDESFDTYACIQNCKTQYGK